MNAFLPIFQIARWRGLLTSLVLLLLLPALSRAQAPSVGQIINPDGTLRPGAKGSFSTAGYRMGKNAATGAPVFRPTGAGDEKWQDGFNLPGLNSAVQALAVDGSGNVYAAGSFSEAGGTPASSVAKWDGTRWSALGTAAANSFNNTVVALAVDGSGNVYAGGGFTTAGGVPANRVARWNGTSWSALGSGISGFNQRVNALAVDGSGNVYAGGVFTEAGGMPANNIARWNGTSWSALGAGTTVNTSVFSLAVDGSGNAYVGGDFTTAGGVPANRVARWNGTSWSALGAGMNSSVYALAIDANGGVCAGGTFTTAGGIPANSIARWNGTSWSALGAGTTAGQFVFALAIDGSGNVYAGGTFTTAGGAPANRVARWNGTSWSALGAGVTSGSGDVRALVVYGSSNVYAGGQFGQIGGQEGRNFARWDGASWDPLGAGLDQTVEALAVDGSGNVYAGGFLLTAGGVPANRVAKWNGTSWSALGTGMNNRVLALAVDGNGQVYAGGNFTMAGGVPANNIARWNGTSWSALGAGTNTPVQALAVDGSGSVYAGGGFSAAGGAPANAIARWNGTSWSALGTGVNNGVNALAVDGSGNVYAGGSFTTAGGVPANCVARWNGTSWSALGSGVNNSFVFALAVDGSGNVYAGGNFTTAGGTAANYVARWNGTSWSALGAGVDNSVVINSGVLALAVDGSGSVYAGGTFTTAGGAPASRVAKWNGTSWSALGTGLNGNALALALKGNDLQVGGSFTATGDGSKTMTNFGIYRQTQPAVVVSSSTGASGSTSAANPFAYTVTFSAPVTGFVAADVSVTNGTLAGFAGSGTTYTFTVAPTASGAVTVSVAANVAQDQATNTNTASNIYTLIYSPGATAAPVLSAPANASFANTATPTYAGTAPAGSTVTVYVDGAAIGTTTAATNGSFSFAQPTALSQGSHTAYATAQSGGSTGSANSNTNSFTVDTVVPTVAISSTASSPTSTSPIPVTVTFSESVTGFVASDVLVTNGTLSGFAGSGTTYTFTVTPAASGAVTVSVAANVAQDAATNGNTAATPLSIQYVAPAALATVSTATPGAITTTSATLGGNVTADGGSAVAERGVVYSISNTTPTAADTKVSVGSGTGSFSQAVTGLTAGTTYYVRAYATNSTGTSYGGSQTFVTTATAAQNLTVSTGSVGSPVSIAAGTYNNVTVTSTGFAVLSGAVVVNGSFVVTGSLNTNCQPLTGSGSFALQAGSTLYVCDPAGISVSGNTGAVQVSGTRSFSDNSSYSYNGSQPQVTGQGLPAQVLSLSTTNNSPLTLTAPVGVRQVLTVGGAGNLNLNGQALTLRSSAGGTALVVNAGTGLVQGTATVQRFIDGSANSGSGYRHYSAPVANTTVADLATSGFTPTLTQSYNTSTTPGTTTPFPTVFGYDQARLASVSNNLSAFDKGFVVPQANDALVPGRGYAVQIGAGELVDFRGTLGTGLLSVNLLRNSGPTAADAGWALVGNPYPAPLDYSQVLPADRTGLDAAVYMVQSSGPYTGTYRAFVNGQSTTGSNNPLIASGQGFFVRVSQGSTSGQLTFRNGQRVTDYAVAQQTTFQRIAADTRPALRLTLAGSSGTDGWVSYAETSATAGFDREFDAAKLPNPSGLNLSSTTGAELLAIDGRPAFTAATLLPLTVSVPAAGSYSLEAAALANLPAGLTASLRDALTGTVTPLAAGTRYAFTVTAAQAAAPLAGRFAVQFAAGSPLATAPAALTAAVRVYPNPARSSANVMLPGVAGTASVQLELLNAIGQVVLRQQAALPAAGTTLTLPTAGLSTGVYLVRVQLGKAQLTKRLIIE